MFYIGESERTGHDRFAEHQRYASNPISSSYREEAFALHYMDHHQGIAPELQFEILKTGLMSTVRRKIEKFIKFMMIN